MYYDPELGIRYTTQPLSKKFWIKVAFQIFSLVAGILLMVGSAIGAPPSSLLQIALIILGALSTLYGTVTTGIDLFKYTKAHLDEIEINKEMEIARKGRISYEYGRSYELDTTEETRFFKGNDNIKGLKEKPKKKKPKDVKNHSAVNEEENIGKIHEKVRDLINKFIQGNPDRNNSAMLLARAETNYFLGRFKEAKSDVKKFISFNDTDPDVNRDINFALHFKGNIYRAMADNKLNYESKKMYYQKARDVYDELINSIEAKNIDPLLLKDLARVLIGIGNCIVEDLKTPYYIGAKDNLDRATTTFRDSRDEYARDLLQFCLNNLIIVQTHLADRVTDYDTAHTDYTNALNLRPQIILNILQFKATHNETLIHFKMAIREIDKGDEGDKDAYTRAKDHLETAIQLYKKKIFSHLDSKNKTNPPEIPDGPIYNFSDKQLSAFYYNLCLYLLYKFSLLKNKTKEPVDEIRSEFRDTLKKVPDLENNIKCKQLQIRYFIEIGQLDDAAKMASEAISLPTDDPVKGYIYADYAEVLYLQHPQQMETLSNWLKSGTLIVNQNHYEFDTRYKPSNNEKTMLNGINMLLARINILLAAAKEYAKLDIFLQKKINEIERLQGLSLSSMPGPVAEDMPSLMKNWSRSHMDNEDENEHCPYANTTTDMQAFALIIAHSQLYRQIIGGLNDQALQRFATYNNEFVQTDQRQVLLCYLLHQHKVVYRAHNHLADNPALNSLECDTGIIVLPELSLNREDSNDSFQRALQEYKGSNKPIYFSMFIHNNHFTTLVVVPGQNNSAQYRYIDSMRNNQGGFVNLADAKIQELQNILRTEFAGGINVIPHINYIKQQDYNGGHNNECGLHNAYNTVYMVLRGPDADMAHMKQDMQIPGNNPSHNGGIDPNDAVTVIRPMCRALFQCIKNVENAPSTADLASNARTTFHHSVGADSNNVPPSNTHNQGPNQ